MTLPLLSAAVGHAPSGLRCLGFSLAAPARGRSPRRRSHPPAPAFSRPRPSKCTRQRRGVATAAAGKDGGNPDRDEPSALPDSTESLFMKELRRRGVSSSQDLDTKERRGVDFKASSTAKSPFESIAGAGPLNSATKGGVFQGTPQEIEDQLERSRKLNSEGLEGLVPRATELLKLGGSQFLAFLPFMGAGAALFVGCYVALGTSFIHGAEPSSGPPPYVDPYLLLQEPTVDPMVPLR